MDHVSKEGRRLLERLRLDDSANIFETLSHDGYDADGPRSNLWDLYVIRLDTATVEAYHREDWFHEPKEAYEHTGSFPLAVLLGRLSLHEKERLIFAISDKKMKGATAEERDE